MMTNTNTSRLPKWKCHKIVSACKIGAISTLGSDNSAYLLPEDKNLAPFHTAPGWYTRYQGSKEDEGYFVEYDDDFQSWSPSEAFEKGYTMHKESESLTDEEAELVRVANAYWQQKNKLKELFSTTTPDDLEVRGDLFKQLVLESWRFNALTEKLNKYWTLDSCLRAIIAGTVDNPLKAAFNDTKQHDSSLFKNRNFKISDTDMSNILNDMFKDILNTNK